MDPFVALPRELASHITALLGFHQRPRASTVSKTWHRHDALKAARASHAATLASGGTGDEFFRLTLRSGTSTLRSGRSVQRVLAPPFYVEDYGGKVLTNAWPLPDRVILRTNTSQNMRFAHVVVIDTLAGEVRVYDHPDDERVLERVDLARLALQARYDAVGLFVGLSRMCHYGGRSPHARWGDTILLQLAATVEGGRTTYNYAYVGDEVCEFSLQEPVTRFFSNVGNNHAQHPLALTASEVLFLKGYVPARVAREVMLREPRTMPNDPTNAELVAAYGEAAYELFMRRSGGDLWGVTGGVHLLKPGDRARYEWVDEVFPVGGTVARDPLLARVSAEEFQAVMMERTQRLFQLYAA